ncbi:helix-turn-helix domain-containing protein [Nonomuraea muscovyensis]|uniref:helix-turn-helix domain-containing protein n=1 Tax=Nonomuraea muscovyensis TaxID=1124761 RepID=UPI0033CC0A1C
MSETWTIGELAERAAGLLRTDAQRGNGRVRDVPGERLIRWYTTIGLVDPPLSRRGRLARYGRRHLLQLVAVKRLQATGHSIADIQAALAGATDAMLEAFAETLDGSGGGGSGRDAGGRETAGRGDGEAAPERARFWARAPLDHLTGEDRTAPDRPVRDSAAGDRAATDRAAGETVTAGEGPAAGGPVAGTPPGPVTGVRIAPGVTLVLDRAGRTPTPDDVHAVLAAAEPLLAVLEERNLA